jgi:EVE domain
MPDPSRPAKSWIAVASANHVAIGRAQGFMQVNHGKAAPLKRALPGDRVIYYAPTRVFGGKERLQAFVAHGRVAPGDVYQGVMSADFIAFRRDVIWDEAHEAPIAPLLPRLSFTAGRLNWGQPFRWGFFEISDADAELIAEAMGVSAQAGLTISDM